MRFKSWPGDISTARANRLQISECLPSKAGQNSNLSLLRRPEVLKAREAYTRGHISLEQLLEVEDKGIFDALEMERRSGWGLSISCGSRTLGGVGNDFLGPLLGRQVQALIVTLNELL